MQRFYEKAELIQLGTGYGVALDGKPLSTPAKARVEVSSKRLAELLVEEWQNAPEEIHLPDMIQTRLVATVIDQAQARAGEWRETLAAYAGSDLLCYREDRRERLMARQAEIWDPILAWARQHYGVSFVVVSGVMPTPQPAETVARLAEAGGEEPFRLAGLARMAGLLGSTILALAVENAHISVEEAWQASQLDVLFQIEEWGEDTEAMEKLERQRKELAEVARYCAAIKGGNDGR